LVDLLFSKIRIRENKKGRRSAGLGFLCS